MPICNARLPLIAAMAIALSAGAASAACTDKDQENKVTQLSALMTPLAQKDPARAQKISEGMSAAMMLEGDAACASLDKLIAQAK